MICGLTAYWEPETPEWHANDDARIRELLAEEMRRLAGPPIDDIDRLYLDHDTCGGE